MIRRLQKAPTDVITDEQLGALHYPIVGSPKLDGFRCTVDDEPKTSAMKSFVNPFVVKELSDPLYHGLDGELIVGDPKDPDAFHNTSGPLRRHYGEPDFKFYTFDRFLDKDKSYDYRWLSMLPKDEGRIIVLEQRLLYFPEDVLAYEKEMLATGFEGAMIRSIYSRYKEGRCTFNELNIFKRKPFVDTECIIVGFVEAMENCNEQETNELGLSKRSHKKENLVLKGTLGSFLLQSPLWKKPFNAPPGKGFDDARKLDIWKHRVAYIGETVTISYQKYGSRDAPRIPKVTKLRPFWDL